MRKICFALLAFFLFSSHDMFLKMDSYFLQPNTKASIQLFNGTFDRSENSIDRERMLDVSLAGNGQRTQAAESQWREVDSTTVLDFKTGEAATWVAGVSTRARNIELTAKDFNEYLVHDGVLDMLQWRKDNNAMDKDAVEKYSKHVKTIFQVGNKKTKDWQTVLGYPIEFVPLENPYELHAGHELRVKLLWKGQPLANQLVYIGSGQEGNGQTPDTEEAEEEHEHADGTRHTHDPEQEHEHEDGTKHTHSTTPEHTHEDGTKHSHGTAQEHEHKDGTKHSHTDEKEHTHDDGTTHTHGQEKTTDTAPESDHSHTDVTQMRTDSKGELGVPLSGEGVWYLRTIYMTHSEEEGLTHESNWATLTFALGQGDGHSHSHGEADHDHAEDDHSHEIPSYVYWIGSLILVTGLFFWFNRKK